LTLTTVMLGGFRGLISDLLWLRVSYLQSRGEYFEIVQLADWITKLSPRSAETWAFHAWNMSYNVSAMMPDPEDRWRWVRNGIALLRDDGLRCVGENADLYASIAGLYLFKIGGFHDKVHDFYRRRFAEEMTRLLGGARPDYAALEADPARRTRLIEDHKLDPELMQRVDDKYGPLDWRLPATHAIYWGWRGRAYAKDRQALLCDRFIFQGMAVSFKQGRLLFSPQQASYRTLPNPALLPKAIRTYEEMAARHPEENVRTSYASFLRQAVLILHTVDRQQAMTTFELLRRKFSAPDTAEGYDAFVAGQMATRRALP
jgi:hypothetical protein